jgi:hypothetical protein
MYDHEWEWAKNGERGQSYKMDSFPIVGVVIILFLFVIGLSVI